MIDIVDEETRSRMMSGIRAKNTRPEITLRKALHAKGFRFRVHVSELPGKPDIVLKKYKAAIFVHGCFWHHHHGCRYATVPKTRPDFWIEKFKQNQSRDDLANLALKKLNWRVAVVWECGIRNSSDMEDCVNALASWLLSASTDLEIGAM